MQRSAPSHFPFALMHHEGSEQLQGEKFRYLATQLQGPDLARRLKTGRPDPATALSIVQRCITCTNAG
jgi:hypothetical protein